MLRGHAHRFAPDAPCIGRVRLIRQNLNGARPGRVIFKDGSVIVFDLLEDVTTVPNVILEGERRAVVVMEKDSRRYATTGGWGFQGI